MEMRVRKASYIGGVVAIVGALLLGAGVLTTHGFVDGPSDSPVLGHGEGRSQIGGLDSPDNPDYPRSWRVGDYGEASKAASFRLLMPHTPATGADRVTDAWVFPSGAVALDFPSPGTPEQRIRQNYIEVYEAPWPADIDPLKEYQADLADDPSPAKSLTSVDGVPVLTVEAHSPHDFEGANPAFLRFVVDGTEIQVSGGEDLDVLLKIAQSIIEQANGDPSA